MSKTAHFLSPEQRQSLRNLARPAIRPGVYAPNRELDLMIEMIKIENPAAFHTPASLWERRFFDQPAAFVPCAGYEVEAPKDFEFGYLDSTQSSTTK